MWELLKRVIDIWFHLIMENHWKLSDIPVIYWRNLLFGHNGWCLTMNYNMKFNICLIYTTTRFAIKVENKHSTSHSSNRSIIFYVVRDCGFKGKLFFMTYQNIFTYLIQRILMIDKVFIMSTIAYHHPLFFQNYYWILYLLFSFCVVNITFNYEFFTIFQETFITSQSRSCFTIAHPTATAVGLNCLFIFNWSYIVWGFNYIEDNGRELMSVGLGMKQSSCTSILNITF